jgi:hypothetical protein
VRVSAMHMHRVSEGRFVEHWEVIDLHGLFAGHPPAGASLVRVIEGRLHMEQTGMDRAERFSGREVTLRQEGSDSRASGGARLVELRSVGILYVDNERSQRVHEHVPLQQAEIGDPIREIEVTPIEEPVPDFAPAESPAEPVREPERVPA